MERNVYSFKLAISKGHELRLYTYNADKTPVGLVVAILDFKTWSKRIIAINCYFTKMDSEEKFIVTVYCNNQTEKFQLQNSVIDFTSCPTNHLYHLTVLRNNKGKIILGKAELICEVNR